MSSTPNVPPVLTTNVMHRVLWLGRIEPPPPGKDGPRAVPIGSAVLVESDGRGYMVTARHVVYSPLLLQRPLIRMDGIWKNGIEGMEFLVDSEEHDIAVFSLPEPVLDAFVVDYGPSEGALHSQLGYALGFPGFYENDEPSIGHIAEMEGRPIPIPTLLSLNLWDRTDDIVYCASYINAGYSGGAIVYPVPGSDRWAIAGIITHFPTVAREVIDYTDRRIGISMQHTGLVGFRPWRVVERLIEKAQMRPT